MLHNSNTIVISIRVDQTTLYFPPRFYPTLILRKVKLGELSNKLFLPGKKGETPKLKPSDVPALIEDAIADVLLLHDLGAFSRDIKCDQFLYVLTARDKHVYLQL